MHPNTIARERERNSWASCAGVMAPAFRCVRCGARKLIRNGYKVPANKRGKVCLACHTKESA